MNKTKLTTFAKLVIALVVMGAVLGVYKIAQTTGVIDKVAPVGKSATTEGTFSNDKDVLRVGVVTWGGYAGGQYFNKGFKANKKSRFYKDYGIKVEFVLNDDFVPSREAWKADKVDVLWGTADSFPIEAAAMAEFNPKIIFQADWSRGGDAVVVRRGINKVNDLKGKKVSFASGTPSHTFLLWMLTAADMTQKDIIPVETDSAVQAATFFKSGKVDAAVVWSPDDEDCVKTVSGAKVLKSTKEAANIIADIFFVKDSFLQTHKELLAKFVEGFLKGAGEINNSESAKTEAAKILSEGLNVPEDFALKAINNVRLATFGDNLNFFGLDRTEGSVTGEELYTNMGQVYANLNIAQGKIPNWRTVTDPTLVKVADLSGDDNKAEKAVTFTAPTEELAKKEAFSTKRVSITYPSGSAGLDDNAKYIIQMKFGDVAKSFSRARIRIEGNTDSVGSEEMNKKLSYTRAQSVVTFLIKEYGFDSNRFIIKGNGSSKPVAPNSTSEGKSKNRRTDFDLVSDL